MSTMEIHLDQVRELLDEPAPELPNDLHELYAHFNLPAGSSLSRSAVADHIRSLITPCLGPHSAATRMALRRQCIYEHVLENTPWQAELSLLDAVPTEYGAAEQDVDWQQALRLTRLLLQLRSTSIASDEQLERTYRRHINVARAAQALRERRFAVAAVDGRIQISDEPQVTARIDGLMRQLGGPRLLNTLFGYLDERFDPEFERYPPPRIVQDVPQPRPPTVPFGYLLNCAAKLALEHGPQLPLDEAKLAYTELISLARDYLATMDVEAYSSFERMLFHPAQILNILDHTIAFDENFFFPQLAPRHTLEILANIFHEFDEQEQVNAWGGSIQDVLDLCRFLLHPDRLRRGPNLLTIGGLPPHLRAILARLTHDSTEVNPDYHRPLDPLTFPDRPLIRGLNENEYLLLNPYWCGEAFYRALALALRHAGTSQVSRRIGPGVERVIHSALTRRGIKFSTGKYVYLDTDTILECDCVIESKRDIFLIEIKKRPLTPRARRGDRLALLLDLTEGLLKAHTQARRHQIQLQTAGAITYTDGSKVELGTRNIELVCVTLTEYGTLHDRQSARAFLMAALTADFHASPEHDHRLRRLRNLQQTLRDQLHTLRELGVEHPERFLPTSFISVSQLLTLADDTSSADTLGEALRTTRHVTSMTGDLLGDYKYFRNLRRNPG